MTSWVIDPDGYASAHTGVVSTIGPFGESTRLMEVTFEDGITMLFPLAKQFGGKWRYETGLRPKMTVAAQWVENAEYVEGDEDSGPRAFFEFDLVS